jgi:hypothetical protein
MRHLKSPERHAFCLDHAQAFYERLEHAEEVGDLVVLFIGRPSQLSLKLCSLKASPLLG